MLIEGRNQVVEAIKNGKTINKLYVDLNYAHRKDEVISLAKQFKIKVEFEDDAPLTLENMNKLARKY